MKEIGGYFELELNKGQHYHNGALALNSARNCLKYILKAKQPSKVYVPAYSCDSLLEPIKYESTDYIFYHINEKFEITNLPSLKKNEKLIYINYFGLKSEYINFLYKRYKNKLIIDKTQAFFEMPIDGIDTFYSPRKFFGVPDGGYLYTDTLLDEEFDQDHSANRFTQLLGRYENTASEFYNDYQTSENSLIGQPIKWMSKLTQGILKSLDYEVIALKRQRNFWALHSQLIDTNEFQEIQLSNFVPMVYPFKQTAHNEQRAVNLLRQQLISNKIYVAKYWEDAIDRVEKQELQLIDDLLFLSVDQRILVRQFNRIIKELHAEEI